MPRNPSTPRLTEVDADEVARQVSAALFSAATRISDLTGWTVTSSADGDTITERVKQLVTWAKTGDPGNRVTARNLLDELLPALFSRAIDGPSEHEPPIHARTDLGLVLCAALGRCKIEDGDPVPAGQLAALGGVDVSRVRQHIRQGDLRRTTAVPSRGRTMDAPVVIADALGWLMNRGTVGIAVSA